MTIDSFLSKSENITDFELRALWMLEVDFRERLDLIIEERKEMIANLRKQGITSDFKGIEDIEIVGCNLLTIALIHSPIGSD